MVIHNETLKSGIFAKLDWFSCIFEDVTFADVLNFLSLDPDIYVGDFLTNRTDISQGFEVKVRFSYESVGLEANVFDVLKTEVDNLFYTQFSKVKLDISGHGLDFLRSTGLDVDNYLRDRDNYSDFKFHTTRVDFAYDLINYKPELVDELIKYCQTNCTDSGRVCTLHSTGAYKCSVRTNSEKTVYVGSPSSLRLLRVYDKRLEQIDPETGVYKKENIYGNPDSWNRIELQTRRHVSQELLFGEGFTLEPQGYWLSLFRYIYEQYTFSNVADSNSHNRAAADFWINLFNWGEIRTIIQNENSVLFVPYGQRVMNDWKRNIGRFIKWISVAYQFAVDNDIDPHTYINNVINHFLLNLQTEPREKRHLDAFLSQLNMLYSSGNISISDDTSNKGFYRDFGCLQFNF